VATVTRWGLTVSGLEALLFAWISLALGLIDLDHKLLPDVLTLPTIGLGLGLSFAGGLATPLSSVLGAVVGAGIPAFIIVAYKALRGIEGMGWGDVKYLAAIGAVTGLEGCLWILIAGAILGALTGVALILAGRGGGKTELPFGTFLAAAVLLWLYAAPWLPAGLTMVPR
jgi:leader peptidase (prepilin peptidase)/N-methyltransferase